MNIHKSQLFWASLGARVLTNSHILVNPPPAMTSELQLQVLWYGVATSSGTQGARKAAAAAASVTKAGNRKTQVHGRKPPMADVDE